MEIEKALAKQRQIKGGKNGRNLQLGLAPDGAEPRVKAKATEVVAKRAGVSTRTFERGKKIIESASEDDKQKLREGKASISKVYNEITQSVSGKVRKDFELPDLNQESPGDLANKAELKLILERLQKKELFCSVCGGNMFECSKCHKTLRAILEGKNSGKASAL